MGHHQPLMRLLLHVDICSIIPDPPPRPPRAAAPPTSPPGCARRWCPEDEAGWLSRLLFSFVGSLMAKGQHLEQQVEGDGGGGGAGGVVVVVCVCGWWGEQARLDRTVTCSHRGSSSSSEEQHPRNQNATSCTPQVH